MQKQVFPLNIRRSRRNIPSANQRKVCRERFPFPYVVTRPPGGGEGKAEKKELSPF